VKIAAVTLAAIAEACVRDLAWRFSASIDGA
jgi:hypothetical protein